MYYQGVAPAVLHCRGPGCRQSLWSYGVLSPVLCALCHACCAAVPPLKTDLCYGLTLVLHMIGPCMCSLPFCTQVSPHPGAINSRCMCYVLSFCRIRHTLVLDDPYPDPPELEPLLPPASPEAQFEQVGTDHTSKPHKPRVLLMCAMPGFKPAAFVVVTLLTIYSRRSFSVLSISALKTPHAACRVIGWRMTGRLLRTIALWMKLRSRPARQTHTTGCVEANRVCSGATLLFKSRCPRVKNVVCFCQKIY